MPIPKGKSLRKWSKIGQKSGVSKPPPLIWPRFGPKGGFTDSIWKKKSNPPKKSVGRIRQNGPEQAKTAKIEVNGASSAGFVKKSRKITLFGEITKL